MKYTITIKLTSEDLKEINTLYHEAIEKTSNAIQEMNSIESNQSKILAGNGYYLTIEKKQK